VRNAGNLTRISSEVVLGYRCSYPMRRSMYRRTTTILLVLFLVCLSSCARSQETPGAEEPSIIGEEIQLTVGETFEISQPGLPASGYSWDIETAPSDILEPVGELVVELESDDIDATGAFIYTFRAVAAGTTYIKLIYHQPFEDNPPESVYEATIIVQP